MCIYSKFNAPPKQKGQSSANKEEKSDIHFRMACIRSFAYVFRFVYSFWCRLSFILTFVYYNRTQHALISLTHSLIPSFMQGTAMSILFAPLRSSHRPFTCALPHIAISFRRAHTITHSSTRVPFASTPCVRTLAHTYILYIHIYFSATSFLFNKNSQHTRRYFVRFFFLLFFAQLLLTFSLLAVQLLL